VDELKTRLIDVWEHFHQWIVDVAIVVSALMSM